jgi:hypothetical protein
VVPPGHRLREGPLRVHHLLSERSVIDGLCRKWTEREHGHKGKNKETLPHRWTPFMVMNDD